MNYIQHMNQFLLLVQKDTRMKPSHISLYMALFQQWNLHYFVNPITLHRRHMLQTAHIGSKNTYTNCLKELHQFGYINYHPALHKYHCPKVSLRPLDKQRPVSQAQLNIFSGQTTRPINDTTVVSFLAPHDIIFDTGTVPFLVHYNIKQGNPLNLAASPAPIVTPAYPSLEMVQAHFKATGYPAVEANRFFYHYETNGWKQAGKSPIKSWQAAAGKWMTNPAPSFKKNTAHSSIQNNLHAGHLPSYSDPL